ncbi:hypothetical protein Pmar_PMAR018548 [Perkinsus marinus ATCC 50983]|uniref:Uncharacterized protein n=1 Tax=Perkinsus marinus (strain ATCC 50983 / TXsc) TaxID=423536 RepID=C5L046_PERM5|nr:hypothetical protein Pmar_PMAR018548 [Perkinsus marinus ATCC 50983]EER09904.1 hypothetical protein Pmar_PMAR018548 [Perkinsus marinus ATCC 50983]|eukprot:XP_002778109.1 hypothetical protein Pmar_PMAR018548 [Perkinsus marinus ATCC 50983]
MSGEAYEKAHGKGACRDLETGCYFCPPTQPCDDISEQPGKTITYLDGDTMEYINRIGTLSIGEVENSFPC